MKKEVFLQDWIPINYEYVCGIDETGFGSGAGPVVVGAVIMPRGFKNSLIRDSKKLSEKQRNEAYKIIEENAISISVKAGSAQEINKFGISDVTFKLMHECIRETKVRPNYVIVDGTNWREYEDKTIPVTLIPKGDDIYTCIAAASIVAKVKRDEYMCKIHELHPEYAWNDNKGYLTEKHINAIKEHGHTSYHRLLYIKNFIKK